MEDNVGEYREASEASLNLSSTPTLKSYVELIGEALQSSPSGALTLAGITRYLRRHYAFFRGNYQGWRNSIRHNLSLNQCFRKILRDPRRPYGKDNLWTVDLRFFPTPRPPRLHHSTTTTTTPRPPRLHHSTTTTTTPRPPHLHHTTTTTTTPRPPQYHSTTTTPRPPHFHNYTTTTTPRPRLDHSTTATTTPRPPRLYYTITTTTTTTPPQPHLHHSTTTTPLPLPHHSNTTTPLPLPHQPTITNTTTPRPLPHHSTTTTTTTTPVNTPHTPVVFGPFPQQTYTYLPVTPASPSTLFNTPSVTVVSEPHTTQPDEHFSLMTNTPSTSVVTSSTTSILGSSTSGQKEHLGNSEKKGVYSNSVKSRRVCPGTRGCIKDNTKYLWKNLIKDNFLNKYKPTPLEHCDRYTLNTKTMKNFLKLYHSENSPTQYPSALFYSTLQTTKRAAIHGAKSRTDISNNVLVNEFLTAETKARYYETQTLRWPHMFASFPCFYNNTPSTESRDQYLMSEQCENIYDTSGNSNQDHMKLSTIYGNCLTSDDFIPTTTTIRKSEMTNGIKETGLNQFPLFLTTRQAGIRNPYPNYSQRDPSVYHELNSRLSFLAGHPLLNENAAGVHQKATDIPSASDLSCVYRENVARVESAANNHNTSNLPNTYREKPLVTFSYKVDECRDEMMKQTNSHSLIRSPSCPVTKRSTSLLKFGVENILRG
ncbi:hypothetical protein Pcinc_024548 [Petrolisthes cinctipes]|uniref:Fork-head domain-containing protein n=1 Tax=Petrolisthes cinctipes TaxID=88211 RepID=A0AAE1KE87_PETCI|nr:hypothetical protein Pcinc_024548 [Petrolisthes cinctipes]